MSKPISIRNGFYPTIPNGTPAAFRRLVAVQVELEGSEQVGSPIKDAINSDDPKLLLFHRVLITRASDNVVTQEDADNGASYWNLA
jgi:hypothetical protein